MNIIFDVAGVLLEWHREIMLEHLPNDKAREIAMREIVEHPDWLELDKGTISDGDAVERAASRSGLECSDIEKLYGAIARSLSPNDEAIALLGELSEEGHRLFCITNLHTSTYRELRSREQFWSHFEGVIASCDVGIIKPDPAIFRLLLGKFGLAAEQCLFIDDRPANVESAADQGLHGIVFADTSVCRVAVNGVVAASAG